MLPEAKSYLKEAGYTDQIAGGILMVCFVGGFLGIQIISRLLHQFMPSHVVDCDHSHDETEQRSRSLSRKASSHHHHNHHHLQSPQRNSSEPTKCAEESDQPLENGHVHVAAGETTPLLGRSATEVGGRPFVPKRLTTRQTMPAKTVIRSRTGTIDRRPSMAQVQKRVMSFVKDTKCNCDEEGPCYGYTDPCGQECFKHLGGRSTMSSRPSAIVRASTGYFHSVPNNAATSRDAEPDGEPVGPRNSPRYPASRTASRDPAEEALVEEDESEQVDFGPDVDANRDQEHDGRDPSAPTSEGGASATDVDQDLEAQHHHHVPTNAFLSLGLQTSIAIALHKFPEGFITYATNHANPSLGFSVFMALFVHNITEGFAMALPLFMALGSRWRALLWSTVLGGLSQPLGAAVAVLWFRVASHSNMSPSAAAYACMFAITAGIMVSVALQLFVEALSLDHNRNLCIFFGFLGMALLGVSSAVAAH